MIIGITGKAGSGKDTVFKAMSAMAYQYDLPVPKRIAFADPLKSFTANILNIPLESVDKFKLRRNKILWIWSWQLFPFRRMSMRHFLQRIGTEGARDVFGDLFWIDQSLPIDIDHAGKLLIVTDIRFDNEARRVRQLGGVIYKVVGPTQTRSLISRILGRSELKHSSESIAWSSGCWEIYNTNHGKNGVAALKKELFHVMPAVAQLFFEELCLPVSETGTDVL